MKNPLVAAAIAVLLVAVFTLTAYAEDTESRVQLTLRGWFSATDVKSNLVEELFGKSSDAIKKMHLGDEIAVEGRLRFQFVPRHGLELRYLWLAKNSDFTIRHPLLFDAQTTLFGSAINSKVDLAYARLGWHWTIFQPDSGHFRLETIVDVSGGEARITDKQHRLLWPFSPANKDSTGVSGIWPTIGLAVTLSPAEWLDFFGEVSGITGISNVDVLDYEAGVRVNPFTWLGIEAGYRDLAIKGSDNGHDARFSFSGPFCGTKLRF